MRTSIPFRLIIGLTAVFVAIGPHAMAQQSFDAGLDIGSLMNEASQQFDMDNQDVVFLLDMQRQSWLPDGRQEQTIHRIIWISTENAVETYGDHRIPYDQGHCTLTVHALRTWRDNRWWETTATGKVETLPHALNHAYDYTNMREMMLLHDGIELPCILEVSYTIADREPFRRGIDGLWLFQREHPAVVSRFEFEVPKGVTVRFACSDEELQPEPSADDARGTITHAWEMRHVTARPRPHTADPAAYVPHIVWSTWKGWRDYGDYLADQFASGAQADSTLVGVVDSLEGESRSRIDLLGVIATVIEERVRLVRYSEAYWWPFPRDAGRIYASGYGHALDRAILAAAMMKEAGFQVAPAFVGDGSNQYLGGKLVSLGDVPTLARLEKLRTRIVELVYDGPFDGPFYDPVTSSFISGATALYGRQVWLPVQLSGPTTPVGTGPTLDRLELTLFAEFDEEKGAFKGKGHLFTTGSLCSFPRMVGVSGESEAFLSSVLSGVLEAAELKEFSLVEFGPEKVDIGFSFEMKAPEADDRGRVALVLGDPAGGLMENLPDDIALYHNQRQSPVRLRGLLLQSVEFVLDTAGVEVIYQPQGEMLHNDCGHAEITCSESAGRIKLTRQTKLARSWYEPEEWSDLRELLLVETNERNRTLLLKVPEAKKDSKEEPTSSE